MNNPATIIVSDEWTITVTASDLRQSDGRTRYSYTITHDKSGEVIHKDDDLQSGCQGGTAQEGLSSLMSFLGAAAEAYGYSMRGRGESDNADIFPPKVMEWAYEHSDEIAMLSCELEEKGE